MYLVHGKLHPRFASAFAALTERLPEVLARPWRVDTVLTCAERFVERLHDRGFLPELEADARMELSAFCAKASLREKLARELGDNPFSLRRIDYRESRFESWRALGVVLHITPANAPLLPFFATLEGLLVGNINWLRPSSSESGLSMRLLQAFLGCDRSGELVDLVAVLPVETDELTQLLAFADGVSAWGGETALDAIRRQLPGGCRWIPWGHKISFAWLVPDALDAQAFDALADEVCRFDQQACSSPQVVFVDSDQAETLQHVGEGLAAAMRRRHPQWPALTPDTHEAADITCAVEFAKADAAFAGVQGQVWTGEGWRIIWQQTSALDPSPLFRTVLLRPLPRHRVPEVLRPWRTRLQTCGLQARAQDVSALSQRLLAAGVNRITPLSGMHDGYSGEPHDGVYALAHLARRVSVTLASDRLPRQATLDLPPAPPALAGAAPIMGRADFAEGTTQAGAQLYFRSGGSSGVPKLSGYTRSDYHRQMQAAADGLFAAGLEPARDRVLNLMYGGNLYGGLLSFFTVLDKLGATHYPMGGPSDEQYAEIAALIIDQGIDTLIGMPSTVHQLFRREAAALRQYGGIRKLLLGGEHMGEAQRAFIASFGVETLRSALYGSVDAGPLGHACHAAPEGVFHLLTDIQWLEIVALDRDEPVGQGESGRLLFTSRARDARAVVRYDVGDLGRWVEGECACGAAAPRFELLGRQGSLIRIGTLFLQPQRIAELAAVPVQLILEHNPDTGLERVRLQADGDSRTVSDSVRADPELAIGLEASLLELEVCQQSSVDFERHPQSGKTPLVIDKRR